MSKVEDNVGAEADPDVKPKVNFDSILVNELGQFGNFQRRTLFLVMIPTIFASWGFTEYVFSTARINTRCVIPECDGAEPEWSPYWLSIAVPAAGQSAFDNCQRFGNTTALPRLVDSDTCPSTLFDSNVLQSCDKYVYENTDTIAYDFGLACDEWRRSLIGTVRTLGILTALPITGFVSDRWGRRVALTINGFNSAWLGLLRYWSPSYAVFILLEFSEAAFGSGSYSSSYILFTELVGPRYREVAGATINSSFSLGQILLGLIAWAAPDWKILTLILYSPQFLMVAYFWIINESIRWYMSKGRFDKSDDLLRKMAKVNGKEILEKSLQALRDNAEVEAKNKALEEERSGKEPWLIVQVFQHKAILLRCIVAPIWWMSLTLVYYGLSVNAVNISGNKYINFAIVAAVDIPGYWTSVFLIGKIGRKPVLIGAYWICAACQVAYIIMPSDLFVASLVVYLIAKYCIAMAGSTLWIYTAELYPTKYRHSLFAFASMMGRIGSLLAPLTPAIGAQWFEELPFVIFGCCAFLSGALVFLTPETLGTDLPDTFKMAVDIGAKDEQANK